MLGETEAFIIRVWREGHRGSRGLVQHVTSGQSTYFSDLNDLPYILDGYLGFEKTTPPQGEKSMASNENVEQRRAEEIALLRREMEGHLLKSSPVYAEQIKLTPTLYGKNHLRHGGLNQRDRILLAVGMAVHSGAESNIEWTITRAVNHGISDAEVQDAIDVALFNGGSFTVPRARFAYNTLALRKMMPRKSEQD